MVTQIYVTLVWEIVTQMTTVMAIMCVDQTIVVGMMKPVALIVVFILNTEGQ